MKRISSCDNSYFGWVVYALLAIFLLLPSRSAAQAGTSPELYELTKKCMMLSGTANYDGIKLSNELYDKAVKLGDKYAQGYAIYCLANLYIYYIPGDTLQFVPKINDLMVKAKKLGAIPLADKIYWYETYFFCSNGYFNRALQVAKDWNNYIKNSDKVHEWGETRYYYMMGIIYYRLNNVEDAKKFFDRCFELCEKSKDDNVTEADIWIRQLLIYIQQGFINKSKALQCAKKALAHPQITDLQKMTVYLYLADYYNGADDYGKEFLDVVDKFVELYNSTRSYSNMYEGEDSRLKAIKYAVLGEYDKALEEAKKEKREDLRLSLFVDINKKAGRWEEAFHAQEARDSLKWKNWSHEMEDVRKMHTKELAELNATMGNDRLKAEKVELALANSQMKLGNLQLLTEKERTLRANDALRLVNSMKSDSLNKALVTSQAMKMKAMEEEQAHRDAEQRTRNVIAIFVIALVLTAAAAAIVLWRNEKKHVKKLRLRNKQLIIARNEAQESEKMKGIFVENVSHEIRTPLNAIVGFSGLLTTPGMELSEEEKQEFCGTINKNSELLTAMVNDLLSLSEMGSTQKLVIADCNVNQMCRNAVMTVKHRCPVGVDLLFTSDMTDAATIATDERRVTQVLVNFLTNAEKYTTKGSITLGCSAKKEEGYITFTVTDTGCGIPLDKQAKAFERFEKMGSFTQGIGLGLSICKATANLMKAKIGIDPTYTDGARFYFAVPINEKKG